ncbi:cell division protein FtsQ/DivIB [Flavisolibacter nicotianae]|uniref:cell division protein FtsQ/DivIB n=1 Tax=Flavisolibacter nicotianae TaxID=2364882 RepID=UPI0013C4375B|nr:cell division protein FtsQ/DivIB [Flavisolibacter nicotianae]
MRFKRPIYRYLFYTAWIVVLGGIVTLLVAANSKAKARACKGVVVSINNGGDRIYVEKEDVLKNMQKTTRGPIVNKHTGDINLGSLERNLEANPWIRDAELYFDTKDILHVSIAERVPVARVFTTAGTSFYIDSAGAQMPLLESYSAKLPVVTGFLAARRRTAADSALLQETKEVVRTISADPFWNAQIGQIDITQDRKFELIPVLGSHVIKLGAGSNVGEKLAKLMLFYRQVLPKAGFAKYSALDVQFGGQVVAVRRGPTSVVDSIQLQKNIQELMEKKMAEQEPDESVQPVNEPAQAASGDIEEPLAGDSTTTKAVVVSEKPVAPVKAAPAVKTNSNPRSTPAKSTTNLKSTLRKTNTKSKPEQKQATTIKPAVSRPKAVMPRRASNQY